MRYSLDTNMVIAWRVRADPLVRQRLAEHRSDIGLSSIVLHELYFGAFNSSRQRESVDDVSALGFATLHFDTDDARASGAVRAALRRAGTPIGPYDVLIAGQALARDLVLVTANVREFARVEGLRVENWAAARG